MNEPEKPPEKKPSLLWPMLLWPLSGVAVFWGLFYLILFFTRHQHQTVDVSLGAGMLGVISSTIYCFVLGCLIGSRFARRTSLADPGSIGFYCGLGAAALGLAYNFGGCAAVAGVSSIFEH